MSFGIPVSSCFTGFPSCGGSFQPSGIMLPSGICQVLPASQRAGKLYIGTLAWLDFPLAPLYQLAIVLLSGLYDLFCAHCDNLLSFCLFASSTETHWTHTDEHIVSLKRRICSMVKIQELVQEAEIKSAK